MTLDDDSSIYVGGLPYDIGEESLRKVFYIYGAVLAVKIINDRSIGGKCYGFVTFANPRSATHAIKEMDGKTIDGRVVKVNEVRTRGGRPNFNRESSRRDLEKNIDGDSGRHRGRDDDYDRHQHRDGHRERSLDHDHNHDHDHDNDHDHDHDHDRDHNQNRERAHNRIRGHDRTRDRYVDEERFRNYNRHMDGVEQEQEHERKRERDWERDNDHNVEEERNNSHHKTGDKYQHQQPQLLNRSSFDDRGTRELSLESFNDDQDQVESKLAISNQKVEELQMEISQMEEVVADQQEAASELQEKWQKLEDSLIMAKKLTSHRHLQLAKLHKCYLQVRDYNERLKNSEQELQSLVDSTTMELGNDGGVGDGILTNGRG